MKSIYGLEIIANIALNKAISKIGEKIYRLLYKTYFRTLHMSLISTNAQPSWPTNIRSSNYSKQRNCGMQVRSPQEVKSPKQFWSIV